MGAYDELVLTITLGETTPKQVINILNYLTNDMKKATPLLPGHPFFTMESWQNLFMEIHTPYLSGESFCKLNQDEFRKNVHHFTCRVIMKNGGDYIGAFIHWLLPYSNKEGFHGYTRMDETPEYNYLIHLENNELYYYEIYITETNPFKIKRYKVTADGNMIESTKLSDNSNN